jgi:hypothetical protein
LLREIGRSQHRVRLTDKDRVGVSFYSDVYPKVMEALHGTGLDATKAEEIAALAAQVVPEHEFAAQSQITALRNTTGDDDVRRIFDAFLRGERTEPTPTIGRPKKKSARIAAALEQRGFSKTVARKIASELPDLAKRILETPEDTSNERKPRVTEPVPLMNYGPQDGRPLKLLRGICVPVEKLDTKFADGPRSVQGLTFYSEEIHQPYNYARGEALGERDKALARGDTKGVILELEIPSFLVYSYGHPVLRKIDIEDWSPFIARYAEIDLTGPQRLVTDASQLAFEDYGSRP